MANAVSSAMYHSLKQPDALRILTVKPGQFDDDLSCILEPDELSNEPDYETISYAWGDLRDTVSIKVNGEAVTVPSSSAAALRRMRLPDESRRLWIDAICINQDDLNERNDQVAMMALIYRYGKRNLIHIGESQTGSEVLAMLHVIYNDIIAKTENLATFKSIFRSNVSNWTNARSALHAEIDWNNLWQFLAQPWFSRLWVLQEAVLSPDNLCFYGTGSFDLLLLQRVLLWLRYHSRYIPREISDLVAVAQAARLWDLLDREHGYYWDRGQFQGMSVRSALSMARNKRTSNQRDVVYASLGLMRTAMWNAQLPDDLAPKYQDSICDTLRNATRFALLQDRSMFACSEVFAKISHKSDREALDPEWSSWVPRWNRPRQRDDPVTFSAFYSAGGTMSAAIVASSIDPDVLVVQGIALGKVSWVTSTLYYRDKDVFARWTYWLQEAKTIAAEQSKELEDPTIAATLMAGRNVDRQPVQEHDINGVTDFLAVIQQEGRFPVRLKNIGSQHSDHEVAASKFEQAFLTACVQRRFFTTSNGYFGLGPQVLKPEDVVAVLHGVRHPYVLRRVEQGYRILGNSYVHGFMHGEALDKPEEKGFRREAFNLV